MVAPEKPELPAWLESLRTGDSPAGGPPYFSVSDLIDEGTLPGWMRSENADSPENAPSGPYPAWRPASMPAPHSDSEFGPPRIIAAGSLIDEQALPSWMQEHNSSQQSAQSSLSASSLVQPEALPDWMKVSQSPPGSTLPPVQPVIDPITPVQPIAAQDLIDQQALPPWLSGQSVQSGQANLPVSPAQAPQPYQYSSFDATPKSDQSGLAAASLLDMDALPGWLGENEPQPAQNPSLAPPGQAPFAQTGQAQPYGPLAAASLIDMNALPDWLRASQDPGMEQRSGMPPIGPAHAGNVSNIATRPGAPQPPRVENMRVPSRPRSEMAPHEQSEVAAANVFSSMLGVASAAPSFSSQPQVPQEQGSMLAGYQGGYGGYPIANQVAWSQQPADRSNMPPMPMMSGQEQIAPSSVSKPARRGFLDTIRSWFTR